jgi:hypothetical protein
MSKTSQDISSESANLTKSVFRYSLKNKPSQRLWNYIKRSFDTLAPIAAYHQEIHRKAIEAHKLAPLQPRNTVVLQALEQNGIFTTCLADLNLAPCLLKAQSLIPDLAAAIPSNGDFCLNVPDRQILPSLFLWGLQPTLLNLIENYLQLPVAYHGLYQRRDLINSTVKQSRLWHLDMEDYKILKVIIYLNDVDETVGPFQYLNAEQTDKICQTLNYQHGYLKTQNIKAIVPEDQWQSCTGKAGTVIFVDTARLIHRGKVSTSHDRYTLFYDYTSRFPKRPYYCKSSLASDALLEMSNHLSDREMPFVFWRED